MHWATRLWSAHSRGIRGGHERATRHTPKKARERLVEDRRAFAKIIAAPFEREKTVDARARFVELQATIEAIDRAIEDEEGSQGSV